MNKKDKLIENTLTLSHEIPLFDYNVNFEGLKKLLQDFNIALNDQKQQINQLKYRINLKADKKIVEEHFNILNSSLNLNKQSLEKIKSNKSPQNNQPKRPIQQIAQKVGNITTAINKLLDQTSQTSNNVTNLQKKSSDSLNYAQKKLEEKISDLDKNINKNVQNYFRQAGNNFARLQTLIKQSQVKNAGKIGDAFNLLSKKVSQQYVNSKIDGLQTKIEANVKKLIDNDNVKRTNFSNDINLKLKETQNSLNERQLESQNKIAQLIQKVSKALPNNTFQKQRSKIYQRFVQFKGKTDDLFSKIDDYLQFKKSSILANQKVKQEIINVQDQVQKLKQKNQVKGGLNDIEALLSKFDPHKMCQLDASVNRHTQQIGKLQKKILSFGNEKSLKKENSLNPVQKVGLGAEQVMKFVKDYINNMDVDNRIRKNQKDIYQVLKKNDNIADLEKKFYIFTKQLDIGSINRQLTKKSNQQSTRKQFKITQAKIDQLHQFLKLIRKDLDYVIEYVKKNQYKTRQPSQNALLTGKKLYPISCLSCQPSGNSRVKNGRILKNPNLQLSLEVNQLNKTLNEQQANRRVSLNLSKYKK